MTKVKDRNRYRGTGYFCEGELQSAAKPETSVILLTTVFRGIFALAKNHRVRSVAVRGGLGGAGLVLQLSGWLVWCEDADRQRY